MTDVAAARGFRPTARRRNRIAAGAVLGALAIGGNTLVYTSLQDAEPFVQATQDIPAGTQITADMVRTIDADLDSSVRAISGDQIDLVPGRYARVRVVAGSLVSDFALQNEPLVTPGRSVVSVLVGDAGLPSGLRERSRIQLVIPSSTTTEQPAVVIGRTVGLPVTSSNALASVSLSVEVDSVDAPAVAAADDVRVVLLEQVEDTAAIRPTVLETDEVGG